jgi:purine-binding chemotaxis protein CheW
MTKHTCIVITEVEAAGERAVFGIVADSVNEVVDWNASDIQQAPAFGTQMNADYLVGMAASGLKFCFILDVDKVLSVDELLELPKLGDEVNDAQLTLIEPAE